jgi:hypothetical protein
MQQNFNSGKRGLTTVIINYYIIFLNTKLTSFFNHHLQKIFCTLNNQSILLKKKQLRFYLGQKFKKFFINPTVNGVNSPICIPYFHLNSNKNSFNFTVNTFNKFFEYLFLDDVSGQKRYVPSSEKMLNQYWQNFQLSIALLICSQLIVISLNRYGA